MVVEQLFRNYMTILPSVFIRSAASALCMTLVGHCIFYSSWGLWNESRLMCAQVPWLLLVSPVCVCASGWGCLSSLRGWLMDQRRIAWTGAHDWYADRIWGAACQPPHPPPWPHQPGTSFSMWSRGVRRYREHWLEEKMERGVQKLEGNEKVWRE